MPRVSGLLAPLTAAVALALGLSIAPAASPALARVGDPPVPVVGWRACPNDEAPPGTQCGSVSVPLDYDDPTGPTVRLDLMRVRASDPDHRIGTLFVNPGGPGAPAGLFAAVFGRLVPPVVSRRFDVVGIDPRGTGESAPAICRNPDPMPGWPDTPFPTTRREVQRQLASDRWLRAACRDGETPIVDHMTTADTARDLDLVRQALGDDLLTYYGISYGTQLGTTYAAMFPAHVRAMILDGVLDPIAWSTGHAGQAGLPFSMRVGSHRGSWTELRAVLAACDDAGPRRCSIAGHAMRVWRDVARRLDRAPFRGVRYADLINAAAGALYSPPGIRSFLRSLGRLHRAMAGGRTVVRPETWARAAAGARERGPLPGPWTAPATTAPVTTAPATTAYGRAADPFHAVACADSDNPSEPRRWVTAARQADKQAPGFGSSWTWASSACAGWPQQTKADRFTGPYAVRPSAPVLVVGNTWDPATPIPGARTVQRLLAGSRLLELRGYGHGALATGPCIDDAYADYLVRGDLPPVGKVCRPARPLFPR